MRRVFTVAPILALLAVGCGLQKGFNRGEMESALRSANPIFVSSALTVEEIEKLKPQINLPVRLAVAPPTVSTTYARWRRDEPDSWRPDELAEIESWKEPLEKAGIVSDFIVLPAMLVETCRPDDPGCGLRARRAAAARVQADALLTISIVTAVDEYTNPLAFLNLTIVGMWLAPGHHCDALAMVEGAMLDNRNEYLYAFARGEAQEKLVRPLVYVESRRAVRSSRLRALQRFGREFIKQASQLRTK